MKPSKKLRGFLEKNPLPWLYYDEKLGKLVVIVDNHLMQTYRACEQHFFRSNVEGWQRKSITREDEKQRSWFLDFGIIVHKMMELYYQNFQKPDFDVTAWAADRAVKEWTEMKMDIHAEHKEYKLIGGVMGLVGLLIQYSSVMTPVNEKLVILGSEISFGKNKEVPLYTGPELEIYLAGRMDLIVDDGFFIYPVDHKTEGKFKGDSGSRYEMEEGPTGYVYSLAKVLPAIVPAEQILKRDCSKIMMNLIQKAPADTPGERFKRIAIRKTTHQLEEYRKRMVSTVVHLLKDLERYVQDIPVPRNTMLCSNWFFQDCIYKDVCRQGSREGEAATLSNGYIKLPIWNTESVLPTT